MYLCTRITGMLAIVSPSKDLNYKSPIPVSSSDLPRLVDRSNELIEVLQKKSIKALMKLMDISEKLAQENVLRYKNFSHEFNSDNSRPAMYAFAGDVYRGLDAYTLDNKQVQFAANHFRILSGLYGLLRPLDLMQAYRLEMGIPLKINRKKNLYGFWGDTVSDLLQEDLNKTKSQALINLASQEYFDVLNLNKIDQPIIHIHFREYKNETLRFVSYTAKRARGLMLRFLILNKLTQADGLKLFNFENYAFDPELSSSNEWFFVR